MRSRSRLLLLIAIPFGLLGCNVLSTDPGGAALRIGFRAAAATSGTPSAMMTPSSPSRGAMALEIPGTNGTLTLERVQFIVAEFELERAGAACASGDDNDECEEFEAPPTFTELPLDGEVAYLITEAVPAGTYSGLEFEIEDIELDDDGEEFDAVALLNQIRGEQPDWPTEASLLVVGAFTPIDGTPVPFRVYFEAEIEIEMEFASPMTVGADAGQMLVTVVVDPRLWFARPDGSVLDLSQFDYEATQTLVEFEFEMENGFIELEYDD